MVSDAAHLARPELAEHFGDALGGDATAQHPIDGLRTGVDVNDIGSALGDFGTCREDGRLRMS